jgi:hypothetical protein
MFGSGDGPCGRKAEEGLAQWVPIGRLSTSCHLHNFSVLAMLKK